MNTIELILVILGAVMLPYGILELWRGSGDGTVKLILSLISVILFIAETYFLVLR